MDLNQKVREQKFWQIALTRAQQAHRTPLFHDVARLHALFTEERDSRASGYLREPGMRRAYVGYFAPLNAVKIAALLRQLEGEGLLPRWQAPRVLDLGAGPLTGIAGVWLHFGALGQSHAIDIAARAMEDGRSILRESGADTQDISLQVGALASPWDAHSQQRDLVIVANVLNEMGDPRRDQQKRADIVRRALARLAPGGRLLVVEPGTRVHGRALQQLRDEVLETGLGNVLAPCRGDMPCPLLKRRGDWCHHDLPFDPPEGVQKLERQAKLEKTNLKLSYLLVSKATDDTLAVHVGNDPGYRLIGGVMSASDGQRRYACGGEGLVVLEATKRRLPPALCSLPRGALCQQQLPLGVRCSPMSGGPREDGQRRSPPKRPKREKRP